MVSSGPFFPAWADTLARLVIALVVGGLVYLVVLTLYGVSPKTTSSGYMPEQPVAYSHALHAGELGIDCRYCHTAVERAPVAAVPNTQICMNCHTNIRSESEKLKRIRESNESGMPIPWVRIHDLPDFVYFNHSAHVRRGIGCVSCHGRIDKMEVVYQDQPLNMGWCLDCHRNPERHLRPKEEITNMGFAAEDLGKNQETLGLGLKEEYNINPSTDCYTCHR